MADGLDTLTGGVGSGCLCSVPLQDLQRKGPTRLFYSLVPNKEIFVSPRQEDAVSFIKIAKGAPDAERNGGLRRGAEFTKPPRGFRVSKFRA